MLARTLEQKNMQGKTVTKKSKLLEMYNIQNQLTDSCRAQEFPLNQNMLEE